MWPPSVFHRQLVILLWHFNDYMMALCHYGKGFLECFFWKSLVHTISLVHTVFGVLWVLAYTPMILCFGVYTNDRGDSLVHMVFSQFYSIHQ